MFYTNDLIKLLYSQQAYTAVRMTLGTMLPGLVLILVFNQFVAGIACALGAFARHDVIKFIRDRSLKSLGICEGSVFRFNFRQFCSTRPRPLAAAFVDGRVRAFRLARPAIDTFFRDLDGHGLCFL